MALLLKNGAVFLHVPKTGGNWVTRVLGKLNLVEAKLGHKHSDYQRTLYHERFSRRILTCCYRHAKSRLLGREITPSRFMFCFVRHPLSWYESWWKYMKNHPRRWRDWGNELGKHSWHPNATLNGLGAERFDDFVWNVVSKRPGYVTELFGWYAPPQVSFVGKQENLAEDLMDALRRMGVSFSEELIRSTQPVGVSPVPPEPIAWDPDLRTLVEQLEYPGLVRYGYASFDSTSNPTAFTRSNP